jgi:hypothetical protein
MQQRSEQEFVSATVHLAGSVDVETGHAAHYSAEHVQARIGPVLLYFLDLAAVGDFAACVEATVAAAGRVFDHAGSVPLPAALRHPGQEASLVVRLRGGQRTEGPHGVAAAASLGRGAFISCKVGGLRLVCHDAEALRRLVHVARTAQRVAHALWPAAASSAPVDAPGEPLTLAGAC